MESKYKTNRMDVFLQKLTEEAEASKKLENSDVGRIFDGRGWKMYMGVEDF